MKLLLKIFETLAKNAMHWLYAYFYKNSTSFLCATWIFYLNCNATSLEHLPYYFIGTFYFVVYVVLVFLSFTARTVLSHRWWRETTIRVLTANSRTLWLRAAKTALSLCRPPGSSGSHRVWTVKRRSTLSWWSQLQIQVGLLELRSVAKIFFIIRVNESIFSAIKYWLKFINAGHSGCIHIICSTHITWRNSCQW